MSPSGSTFLLNPAHTHVKPMYKPVVMHTHKTPFWLLNHLVEERPPDATIVLERAMKAVPAQ